MPKNSMTYDCDIEASNLDGFVEVSASSNNILSVSCVITSIMIVIVLTVVVLFLLS